MQEEKFQSSYIPLDIAASVIEWSEGVQGGESCRVDALKDTFAWMRGSINGWYGWSNDGKSEFRDFLKLMKAKEREEVVKGKKVKVDGWKFACFKPEDMNSTIDKSTGKSKIAATRIYKNMAWSLTGKTWHEPFAKLRGISKMTLEEENEALRFVTDHIFVVYPKDRRYKNLLDEFRFLHEKFGIDGFEIDPFSSVILPDSSRGDERLTAVFFDMKEFALETNTVFDIVNHPKSITDVKDKNGKFKVVNQFMVLGGAAWDMKMDGQYSIYRPERHIDPKDPKVEFHNLKQKQAQVVGVERGETRGIEFVFNTKQYYFNGVNPMTGEEKGGQKKNIIDFSKPRETPPPQVTPSDDLPF